MADYDLVQVSELTATETPANTDVLPIQQGTTLKKITYANLKSNVVSDEANARQNADNLKLNKPTGGNGTSGQMLLTNGDGTTQWASPDDTLAMTGKAADAKATGDAIKAVDANLAAPYSTSATYAVGDYCTKDGVLKRCNTAITTAEAWNSAHWDDAKLGGDVSTLRSALSDTNNTFNDYVIPTNLANGVAWTDGAAINATDGTSLPNQTNLKRSGYIDITGVTAFIYTRVCVTSSSAPTNGIAFYDENKEFLSGKKSDYNASAQSYEIYWISVPNNAKYIRASAWKDSLNIGEFTLCDAQKYFDSLQSKVNDLNALLPNTELMPLIKNGTETQGIINSSAKLNKTTGRTSIEIPNNGYSCIIAKAQTGVAAHITFLTGSTASLSDGASVPLCEGETGRHTISAGSIEFLTVPSDCTVINFMDLYAGVHYLPKEGLILFDDNAVKAVVDASVNSLALSHSKSPVTACIIGASIEAGTTHETADSGAVVNPDKAYLTVALKNNGVSVTNLSHGGMGFVRQSSQGSYTAKGIVDSTDFTNYESVYVCLGFNDYNHDQPLGAPTDTVGDSTVCGMLKYVIETIYASNPTTKLFIKKMGGGGGLNSATIPYTQAELETAMETVCASYGVEMVTLGAIANNYTKSIIYPDGVHPTQAIMALMAKDTTGRITFK